MSLNLRLLLSAAGLLLAAGSAWAQELPTFALEMKNVRCQVFHADMQQGKRSYGVIG